MHKKYSYVSAIDQRDGFFQSRRQRKDGKCPRPSPPKSSRTSSFRALTLPRPPTRSALSPKRASSSRSFRVDLRDRQDRFGRPVAQDDRRPARQRRNRLLAPRGPGRRQVAFRSRRTADRVPAQARRDDRGAGQGLPVRRFQGGRGRHRSDQDRLRKGDEGTEGRLTIMHDPKVQQKVAFLRSVNGLV